MGEMLGGVSAALAPLGEALASPEELSSLLAGLGWTFEPVGGAGVPTFGRLPDDLLALTKAVEKLEALPADADSATVVGAVEALGEAIAAVARDARALKQPSGTLAP